MPELCKFTMFLDSGAYGAWRRGTEISLKEYIAFIKKHKHQLSAYVALDVIPGTYGKANTTAMVEASAKKSYDSLRRMRDKGLSPIPVFHQGEDYKWLVKLIEDGNMYIGISPYARSHRRKVLEFLDNSFSIICDAKGNPRVKTHGFGVTSPVMMARVPWYSVDSTSWNLAAAYGALKIPQYIGDKPNYRDAPVTLDVTGERSTKGGYQLNEWADSFPTYYQHALQFLESVGLTVTQVRNAYHMRLVATIKFFQNVEAACQNITFKHRVNNRTTEEHWDPSIVASARKRSFRLIYAVLPTNSVTNSALNFCGVTDRLVSYLDIKDWSEEAIEKYVSTGLPRAPGRRRPKQNWSKRSSYLILRRLAVERRANAPLEDDVVASGNFTLLSPDEGNI
jgi:hypothetical protein